MNRVEILDVKKTILEDNNADADLLREQLKEDGIFYVNVMSSPGAGKTTTLLATIKRLKDRYSIGVMEADIDSAVDAKTVLDAGIAAVQHRIAGKMLPDGNILKHPAHLPAWLPAPCVWFLRRKGWCRHRCGCPAPSAAAAEKSG